MQTFNSKIIKKMRWKYSNKNLNKSHNSPIYGKEYGMHIPRTKHKLLKYCIKVQWAGAISTSPHADNPYTLVLKQTQWWHQLNTFESSNILWVAVSS